MRNKLRRIRGSNKHSKVWDNHHIIPQSVCRHFGIKPDFTGNIKRVRQDKHRAWHLLFGNMTPEMAIQHIRDEWSLPKELKAELRHLKR